MVCPSTYHDAQHNISSQQPLYQKKHTHLSDLMLDTSLQDIIKATKSPLEWQLINSYLEEEGYCLEDLKTLPDDVSKRLLIEACTFASVKMVEIQARIQYLQSFSYEEW
jgi:hypothetical protein